jgi:hypothetical protein
MQRLTLTSQNHTNSNKVECAVRTLPFLSLNFTRTQQLSCTPAHSPNEATNPHKKLPQRWAAFNQNIKHALLGNGAR